jgi:hypothetical protein
MSRSLPRGAAKGFSITADRQPMVVAAGVWSAIRILLKPFEYSARSAHPALIISELPPPRPDDGG